MWDPQHRLPGLGTEGRRAKVGCHEVALHMKHQGCPGTGWLVHLRAGLASGTQFKEVLSPAVNI